jgi:hypothetical protein
LFGGHFKKCNAYQSGHSVFGNGFTVLPFFPNDTGYHEKKTKKKGSSFWLEEAHCTMTSLESLESGSPLLCLAHTPLL